MLWLWSWCLTFIKLSVCLYEVGIMKVTSQDYCKDERKSFFLSLYWICYNIASALCCCCCCCFWSDQGLKPTSCIRKQSPNHRTARQVPGGRKSYIESLHAYSVTQSCPTLWECMDCNPPGSSLSMGFSRQEYWSELPCPSPGDLPSPGIKPWSSVSPALAVGFFTNCATWNVPISRAFSTKSDALQQLL